MGKNSIKITESKFLNFANFLLLLISITILFTVIVMFNIHLFIDILPTSNSDSINFNSNLFSKIPINEIIALIAGVLSAILAIVFSLTIISIENISEKYTPYVLDKYITHHQTSKYTLYIFILDIIAALSFFLVKELISAPLLFVYLIVLIFGFVLCFILLIKYFYFMFDIINPIKFASILTEEIIGYMILRN